MLQNKFKIKYKNLISNDISKRNSILKQVSRSYITLTIILFCMTCITSYSVDVMESDTAEIQNSYSLVLSISEAKNSVSTMETSARGHALYFDEHFYEEYKEARNKFHKEINKSMIYASADKNELNRVIKVRDITNKWIIMADITLDELTANKDRNVRLVNSSGPPRKEIMNQVMMYSNSIMSDERDKIKHNLIENNKRKIIINIILFMASFTTIWTVLTQAKKITNTTKLIINTTENLTNEINLREDLEESLEEVIDIYSSLLNASMDAIIIANYKGVILEASESCYNIFGYLPKELVGNLIVETIIPLHLKAAHLRGMKRYLDTETKTIMNNRIKTEGLKKDGSCFPLELTVVKIRDEKKGSPLFAAFMRNL